mmetsp:Transcript_12566/g.34636  ORF Transcript_12566/g.34636 Transcript_12566/m.34636 type:complete len:81 (+) Transcript_12566:206-448(+)
MQHQGAALQRHPKCSIQQIRNVSNLIFAAGWLPHFLIPFHLIGSDRISSHGLLQPDRFELLGIEDSVAFHQLPLPLWAWA